MFELVNVLQATLDQLAARFLEVVAGKVIVLENLQNRSSKLCIFSHGKTEIDLFMVGKINKPLLSNHYKSN